MASKKFERLQEEIEDGLEMELLLNPNQVVSIFSQICSSDFCPLFVHSELLFKRSYLIWSFLGEGRGNWSGHGSHGVALRHTYPGKWRLSENWILSDWNGRIGKVYLNTHYFQKEMYVLKL